MLRETSPTTPEVAISLRTGLGAQREAVDTLISPPRLREVSS